MNFNDIALFVQVVRSGSFTAAARELGIQTSSVSRRISNLEESLSTRLLQRTSRRLHLTDEGRLFFTRAEQAVDGLEDAKLELLGMHGVPRGSVRVAAPLAFGFLGPIFASFLERHPEVQVEVSCSDRIVELVEEGFDLAIRAGPLADSALIARRLGSLPKFLYASPAYLSSRGSPTELSDLEGHDCLAFGSSRGATWRLVSGRSRSEVAVTPKLAVNDYELLRRATLAGLGVALLPEPDCVPAEQAGELERVLPEWSAEETPVHAVYPSARYLSTAVRALVDHLVEAMR